MRINILAFGEVATILGSSLVMDEAIEDTKSLQLMLLKQYPSLQSMKYSIAVDKKIIHNNTTLTNNTTVALLPPFSGG